MEISVNQPKTCTVSQHSSKSNSPTLTQHCLPCLHHTICWAQHRYSSLTSFPAPSPLLCPTQHSTPIGIIREPTVHASLGIRQYNWSSSLSLPYSMQNPPVSFRALQQNTCGLFSLSGLILRGLRRSWCSTLLSSCMQNPYLLILLLHRHSQMSAPNTQGNILYRRPSDHTYLDLKKLLPVQIATILS